MRLVPLWQICYVKFPSVTIRLDALGSGTADPLSWVLLGYAAMSVDAISSDMFG